MQGWLGKFLLGAAIFAVLWYTGLIWVALILIGLIIVIRLLALFYWWGKDNDQW